MADKVQRHQAAESAVGHGLSATPSPTAGRPSAPPPLELDDRFFQAGSGERRLELAKGGRLWSAVLDQARNRGRAELALDLFDKSIPLESRWARDAAILVWAAGTGRDKHDTEGLVTPVQGLKALHRLHHLAVPAQAAVEQILGSAGSVGERATLLKLIAARMNASDESLLADLRALAELISGQSLRWLIDHTTAYGLEHKRGERQADVTGCGPTVWDLARAEADPLAALHITLDPFDPLDARSHSARTQRAVLEAAGGRGVSIRDWLESNASVDRGTGTDLATYLESALESAGTPFARYAWDELPHSDRLKLLHAADQLVRIGYDVPVLTRPAAGPAHYEVVVDVSSLLGRRIWRVHDPVNGRTRWVGDRALLEGPFSSETRSQIATIFLTGVRGAGP